MVCACYVVKADKMCACFVCITEMMECIANIAVFHVQKPQLVRAHTVEFPKAMLTSSLQQSREWYARGSKREKK